ncbi:hypothetical protein FH972_005039 [Carpinus fangiana]|uniref:Uncharacterized protein n=1 Tax=Carpinus fangiana TaxID=176857 RepID=A0A5N6QNS1_9ROSI|nr:hypothetical protein FH972_005039 [Carpinus fangiana]
MQEGSVQVVCCNCPPNLVLTEQMDSRWCFHSSQRGSPLCYCDRGGFLGGPVGRDEQSEGERGASTPLEKAADGMGES